MKKPTSAYTNSLKRTITVDGVAKLPALMTTEDFGHLVGTSCIHASKLCATGQLPAKKVSGRWLINTAKALEMLGLYQQGGA